MSGHGSELDGIEEDEGLAVLFAVRGTPRPQPRPRAVDGKVVSTADGNAKFWLGLVEREAKAALANIGGASEASRYFGGCALAVDLVFRFATEDLTRVGKPHFEKTPDCDNLAKLPIDACARVRLLAGDDCKIADWRIRKFWCRPGHEGVSVRLSRFVESLPEEDEGPLWIGGAAEPHRFE